MRYVIVLWLIFFSDIVQAAPRFQVINPPEEAYERISNETFKIPTFAGTNFHLYIKSELDTQSQRVTLGDEGASGRASMLWLVTFHMEPRTVE